VQDAVADVFVKLLELDIEPVALAFVEEPPAGVEETDAAVPSACTFWRHAESRLFYAPAEKHFNCPIGAHVMGFDLPEGVQAALGAAIGTMCEVNYISADEVPGIPQVRKPKRGIVYGRLGELPIDPDVVLLWLTPRQAMLFNEAADGARWSDEAGRSVFGRPACAAIPAALEGGRPTMSIGCTGMRTFTEILPDRMLAVVPWAGADELRRSLESIVESNKTMQDYYEEQKSLVA
jgi:uncharacterized protein (DUF169 family)